MMFSITVGAVFSFHLESVARLFRPPAKSIDAL